MITNCSQIGTVFINYLKTISKSTDFEITIIQKNLKQFCK